MIDIAFVNETTYNTELYESIIESIFNETMAYEKNDTYYEVAVIYVTNEKIREINLEYRQKDSVTDVISFALMDEEEMIKDADIPSLGDIFISIDQATKQAADYGHSIEREMGFLACHGLLHLLGYDHLDKDEEVNMFKIQEDILNKLNLKRK